jgi:hypothetical protein
MIIFLPLFSVQRSDTQIGKISRIKTKKSLRAIVLISPDLEAALQPHLPLGCPQEEALRVAQLLLAHQTQRRQA